MGVYGSPMKGTWKMMKFGTLLGMVINSDLTNFGVSKTHLYSATPVQKFNIEMVI